MKYTYLLLIAFVFSCKEKKSYCDYVLPGNIGFMVSNGFFEDYDKKGDHYAILNRVDPTCLESFEYFTGNGFSKTDLMAMWVYAKDTCSLKSKYVEWTLKQQSDTAKKGIYTFSVTTTEPNIIHDTIYIHDTVWKYYTNVKKDCWLKCNAGTKNEFYLDTCHPIIVKGDPTHVIL